MRRTAAASWRRPAACCRKACISGWLRKSPIHTTNAGMARAIPTSWPVSRSRWRRASRRWPTSSMRCRRSVPTSPPGPSTRSRPTCGIRPGRAAARAQRPSPPGGEPERPPPHGGGGHLPAQLAHRSHPRRGQEVCAVSADRTFRVLYPRGVLPLTSECEREMLVGFSIGSDFTELNSAPRCCSVACDSLGVLVLIIRQFALLAVSVSFPIGRPINVTCCLRRWWIRNCIDIKFLCFIAFVGFGWFRCHGDDSWAWFGMADPGVAVASRVAAYNPLERRRSSRMVYY